MDYDRGELFGKLNFNNTNQNSRLIVSQVKLENFKSYGGVRIIGPLHHRFTAIVGPNGSGKSNVIEAILFVFGKKAKDLRQKSVAKLIHSSKEYPDCKFAKVTVSFCCIIDNDDQIDDSTGSSPSVVRGSEFEISRTAYATKPAEYHIDGVKSSSQEVRDLLKDKHGVDLNNSRFLILQGEVENIAMMSRMQLLDYLEEVIGTNVFAKPIETAIEELEKITNDRASQLDRLRLLESEKSACEVEKLKAEEYLKKMKVLCDKKSVVYNIHLNRVRSKLESRKARRDQIQQEIQELEKRLNLDQFEQVSAKLNEQLKIVRDAEEQLNEHKKRSDRLDETCVKLQDAIKGLKRSEAKTDQSIKSYRSTVESKLVEMSEAQRQNEQLAEDSKICEQDMESKREKLEQLRAKMSSVLAPIQKALQEKQQELIPFQKQKAEIECKLQAKTAEFNALQESIEGKSRELSECKARLEHVEASMSKLNVTCEQVGGQLSSLQGALTLKEEARAQLASNEKQNLDVISECRALLENKSSHQVRLIIEELKRRLPSNLFSGIYGRLGDLGYVDYKYDVAASTAASGFLNSVVVSTGEVAQRCVQVLREYRLGRLTFIILTEIRPKSVSELPPAGSENLVNLVSVDDEQCKLAFSFALGDTLVCESLERARDIALDKKRRRRVVTTNGDLFEVHGTLTGGGKTSIHGLIRIRGESVAAVRTENLNSLKQRLQVAMDEVKQIRTQRAALEAEISEMMREKSKLVRELDVARVKLGNLRDEYEDGRRLLKSLSSDSCGGEARACQERAQMAAEELRRDLQRLQEQSSSLEAESEVIRLKLEKASGHELLNVESEFRRLDARLQSNSEQLIRNEVAIKSFEKAIQASTSSINDALRSKEELAEALKSRDRELQLLNQEAHEQQQRMSEHSNWCSEVRQAHRHLETQLEQLNSRRNEDMSCLKDLNSTLQGHQLRVDEAEMAVLKLEKKLATVARDKLQTQLDPTDDSDIEIVAPSKEDLDQLDMETLEIEINKLKDELSNAQFNKEAIEIYREKADFCRNQQELCEQVNETWDGKRRELLSLQTERLEQFLLGFKVINSKLQQMYRMITSQAGSAELECTTDIFTDGISFSVRPPNKTWKNIQHLSGGEKTLSSLSLVFALHYYKPTPIYIMDEIDAALDFRNVSLVANYIKEETKNAQFLIISLRNYMFEMADRLVGIYKTQNVTKCVCIDPHLVYKKINYTKT